MYRPCPQYPMPYQGPEMQYPYYPGLEMQYPMNQYMYPYYPCPGPMPGPTPGPTTDYPPLEVQRMVRDMQRMVEELYNEQCSGQ